MACMYRRGISREEVVPRYKVIDGDAFTCSSICMSFIGNQVKWIYVFYCIVIIMLTLLKLCFFKKFL